MFLVFLFVIIADRRGVFELDVAGLWTVVDWDQVVEWTRPHFGPDIGSWPVATQFVDALFGQGFT